MKVEEPVYQRYFQICLNIIGKPCVVIGGGDVARRKAASLIESKADVTLVSPKLDPVLEYMAFQKEFVWKQREFQPKDLDGVFIAVAATDQREVNEKIANLCREKGILCNVVDAPDEGTFITPTAVDRGPLSISVSTSGISPALASSIRQEIEMAYGEEYGRFLELMAMLRPKVLAEFSSPQQRHLIFERMVSSRAISLLRNGMNDEAHKELEDIVREAKFDSFAPGGALSAGNSKE